MNEVGKKAGPLRDFRNNYAQKLAKRWQHLAYKNHQGTRPTSANEESRDDSRNTKGRDQHQGTRRAGTDQETPRDEINTKERAMQGRKQEKKH